MHACLYVGLKLRIDVGVYEDVDVDVYICMYVPICSSTSYTSGAVVCAAVYGCLGL